MAILKLFHVFCVFIWVGTLLTITRFLGLAAREEASIQARFLRLCRRVYLSLDLPSMVCAVLSGVALLILKHVNMKAPWLHMKLTFAFLLIVCDLIVGRCTRANQLPIKGIGRFYLLLGLIIIIFIAILIAIYIYKAACTC